MTKSGIVRLLPCALLALAACGGRATESPHDSQGAASAGGSGGAAAGMGAGGSSTAGANDAGAAHWDDMFPWFDSFGNGDFPDGEHDRILSLKAEGVPARATLSTHLPAMLLGYVGALSFSARASAPATLWVSVGHEQQTYDYFNRAADNVWPLASVDVGEAWQRFSLQIAEFVPPPSTQETEPPTFYIAFMVDHPGPIEVSLDTVVLGSASTSP